MFRATCRCGSARYEIARVFDAGYCHCSLCRRRSGAPVYAFAQIPETAFSIAAGETLIKEKGGNHHFCGSCGGGMHYRSANAEGRFISIGLGCFEGADRIRPTFHQCVDSKLSWVTIADNLPRFDANRISHPSTRQSPIVADGR